MSRRSSRLAWSLAVAGIALHLVGYLFVALGIGVGTPADSDVSIGQVGDAVAFFAFPLVGGVIASRRPGNAIGWLFLAIGLGSGLWLAGVHYADWSLYAEPGVLPGGAWAALAALSLDVLTYVSMVSLLLLFPDGRLPSRRWRPVLAGLVVGAIALSTAMVLTPGPIREGSLEVENPLVTGSPPALRTVLETVGVILVVPSVILACLAAILRFRRARGVERQQFKWFALAAGTLLVTFVAASTPARDFAVLYAVNGLAFAGIALAVGVAILRYRLYDVDRVISKALVYGALTVVLGGAYVVLVLAGQAVFSSFAGGSDLAIAGSTLVVAALFLPVRGRVQRFVDRCFYRRRYDAQRTLEAFGARLREQVDLETLSGDLRGVVDETMRPAHLSVWLRGGAVP